MPKKQLPLKTAALVLLSTLCFCSCGQGSSTTLLPPASTKDNPIVLGENVQMLTDGDGIMMHAFAHTENGVFRLTTNPNGGGNIIYTDYALRKEMILCNRPECKHNDSSCNGWVSPEEMEGGSGLFSDGEYLYMQRLGNDNAPPLITRMNLDGSNRQELISFPSGAYPWGAVIKDGDTFYTFIDYTEERNGEATTVRYLASYHDGEIQPFCELGLDSFILGVSKYGFVMKERSINEETGEETSTIYLYRLTTGEREELCQWVSKSIFSRTEMERVIDNSLYILSLKEHNLIRIDLSDSKKTVVAENILPEYQSLYVDGAWDNHFVINITTREKSLHYAIDLTTGELTECTLEMEKAEGQGITPYTETEKQFLIFYKIETVETTTTGMGDIPEKVFLAQYYPALINKEDFWANKPNYIPIEPLPVA